MCLLFSEVVRCQKSKADETATKLKAEAVKLKRELAEAKNAVSAVTDLLEFQLFMTFWFCYYCVVRQP